jgi:hypothetical protein
MRIVIKELDKDGKECWSIYENDHILSVYYSEEEAQNNINTVQLIN